MTLTYAEQRRYETLYFIGYVTGYFEARTALLRDTIQAVLEVRFGEIAPEVLAELQSVDNSAALLAAQAEVKTVASVELLRSIWSRKEEPVCRHHRI